MKNLTQSNVKFHKNSIKAAIKAVLKVDAGDQSAYHILSIANGFKNDNEMMTYLSCAHYQLTANLGTEREPFVIKHDLGRWSNDLEAYQAAEDFLKHCPHSADWYFIKDGVEKETKIRSGKDENGLTMTIIIHDNNYEGLSQQLEQINSLVESGDFEGQAGLGDARFAYKTEGEQYDPIADCTVFAPAAEHAIFDDNGIIIDGESEDDTITSWNNRLETIEYWEGDLIRGLNVTVDEALQRDHCMFSAISHDNKTIYTGEIMDILDSVRDEEQEFHLYEHQDITR